MSVVFKTTLAFSNSVFIKQLSFWRWFFCYGSDVIKAKNVQHSQLSSFTVSKQRILIWNSRCLEGHVSFKMKGKHLTVCGQLSWEHARRNSRLFLRHQRELSSNCLSIKKKRKCAFSFDSVSLAVLSLQSFDVSAFSGAVDRLRWSVAWAGL